jgi:hypothetical protein
MYNDDCGQDSSGACNDEGTTLYSVDTCYRVQCMVLNKCLARTCCSCCRAALAQAEAAAIHPVDSHCECWLGCSAAALGVM